MNTLRIIEIYKSATPPTPPIILDRHTHNRCRLPAPSLHLPARIPGLIVCVRVTVASNRSTGYQYTQKTINHKLTKKK